MVAFSIGSNRPHAYLLLAESCDLVHFQRIIKKYYSLNL